MTKNQAKAKAAGTANGQRVSDDVAIECERTRQVQWLVGGQVAIALIRAVRTVLAVAVGGSAAVTVVKVVITIVLPGA